VKVRFTRRALGQMAEILDYIEARSPQGAVIFYRSDATGIVIHGVRHAARRPL